MTPQATALPAARTTFPALRANRCALAALSIAALSACGGGEPGDPPAPTTLAAASQAGPPGEGWVQVQGCVVDALFIPRTGTPVRALSAQGRLLGNGLSDGNGRFILRVPTGSLATLAIDLPNGDTIQVPAGRVGTQVEPCLVDARA